MPLKTKLVLLQQSLYKHGFKILNPLPEVGTFAQMKLNFSDSTITVIGDVMLDVYFMGSVKRLSPEAPVPIVKVKAKTSTLGGAGNVALNLAGLGCKPILMGIRGKDQPGKRLSTILRKNRIQDHIIVDATHPTTTKTRVIGQGQQLLRLDEEEFWPAPQTVCKRLFDCFRQNIQKSSAVIISDYEKGVLQGELVLQIISLCRKEDIPVFIDPKGTHWDRYRGATAITPNTPEIELISDQAIKHDPSRLISISKAVRRKYRTEWLLVTRGPEGMCLIGKDDAPILIPATAKEVFDVSGAGDTVIACLAAGVASGMSFPEASALANLAAGIVVGKLGSQAIALPELQAAFLKNESGARLESSHKIATLNAAKMQVKAWQAAGENVVFTNGCFDLLHPGHIHILNQSKSMGDRLVVGVNTDASIRLIKGPDRPIVSEQDRADVLSALSCVDLIVFFKTRTPLSLIKSLKPDVLVKGADYRLEEVVGRKTVASYGGKVSLVSLLKGYSTTGLVDKVSHKG